MWYNVVFDVEQIMMMMRENQPTMSNEVYNVASYRESW